MNWAAALPLELHLQLVLHTTTRNHWLFSISATKVTTQLFVYSKTIFTVHACSKPKQFVLNHIFTYEAQTECFQILQTAQTCACNKLNWSLPSEDMTL